MRRSIECDCHAVWHPRRPCRSLPARQECGEKRDTPPAAARPATESSHVVVCGAARAERHYASRLDEIQSIGVRSAVIGSRSAACNPGGYRSQLGSAGPVVCSTVPCRPYVSAQQAARAAHISECPKGVGHPPVFMRWCIVLPAAVMSVATIPGSPDMECRVERGGVKRAASTAGLADAVITGSSYPFRRRRGDKHDSRCEPAVGDLALATCCVGNGPCMFVRPFLQSCFAASSRRRARVARDRRVDERECGQAVRSLPPSACASSGIPFPLNVRSGRRLSSSGDDGATPRRRTPQCEIPSSRQARARFNANSRAPASDDARPLPVCMRQPPRSEVR